MTDFNFELKSYQIPGCSIRRLSLQDDRLVQGFLESCPDYHILESGNLSQPGDGSAFLVDLPPGKSLEDKFAYAIEKDGRIIGLLDIVRDYPTKNIFWIGLLLIHPDFRGNGLGRQLVQILCQALPQYGTREIRLGVLEENTAGYRFWENSGFQRFEIKSGRQFGEKIHTVFVMKRILQS